jgi:serine/threonine protein kinase
MFTSPVPEGTVLAGKYRVEQVLGRGGMGVVVSAWHLELDQRVALKFLSANLSESPDAAERFRREARAAARIKSEHVVRVLDVGIVNETMPFMVLEYLEGHDLDDELQRAGPLSVSTAVDYLLQAIEALAEAHAAGIVHRDLKPGNLFVFRRPDGTQMIKVLDFGISKSLPSAPASANQMALTATASIIGSPLYMSPEQMQSPRGVDTRTDIWSLGAILYHLLAGEPPYMGENIAQLCSMLMNSKPVPLSKRRSDVPLELERIVMRCLEKDREDRFANVSELASALGRFASALSHVHVSRAARIRSSSNLELGATARSDGSPAAGYGTQSAWDREQTRRANGQQRWVVPSALGAVAVAAAVAFVFTRRSIDEVEGPAVGAAKASETTKLETRPALGAPGEPRSTAPEVAPLAVAPGASTALAVAPSAALAVAPPPVAVTGSVRAPAPPAWTKSPAPAFLGVKPSKPAPSAGTTLTPRGPGDNGLTDFGGRR